MINVQGQKLNGRQGYNHAFVGADDSQVVGQSLCTRVTVYEGLPRSLICQYLLNY